MCCCRSRSLGGREGHGDPGGRGTGHRSLTSLKSISWQLAGGKPAITNHQVPDRFTHIFQKLFLTLLSASPDRRHSRSGGAGKVRTSPERPSPCATRPPGSRSSPGSNSKHEAGFFGTDTSMYLHAFYGPHNAHNEGLIQHIRILEMSQL